MIVEQAFTQVVAGDTQSVPRTLRIALEMEVDEDTLRTIEAALLLHTGETFAALPMLEEIVERSPSDTRAKSLLAIAYVYSGDWDQMSRIAPELSQAVLPDDCPDIDRLFHGYATVYVNFEQAAERLTNVLEKHPSWALARSFRAIAWAHMAEESGSFEKLQQAIDETRVVHTVTPDNRDTLATVVFVGKVAVQLGYDRDNRFDAEVLAAAERLSHHPDYVLGTALRAQYFALLEETSGRRAVPGKAATVWQELVDAPTAGGDWLYRALAYFCSTQPPAEVLTRFASLTKDRDAKDSVGLRNGSCARKRERGNECLFRARPRH